MKAVVFILLIEVVGCFYGEFSRDVEIIGGYECEPHSQPWQVYLDDRRSFCGGSLINNNWVVTAAHCKSNSAMIVHLGEHNRYRIEGTEQRIQALKQISHPNYNNPERDNDIMLIKLRNPAVINKYVKPVPLSTQCSFLREQCLVSGWGSTGDGRDASTLQCLDMPVLSRRQCVGAYGKMITKNMFCAGFMKGGKDSCQGDSGGPVVCDGELKGVVSFGHGCAKPGFPGVYVEVCRYIEWINTTISRN